MQRTIVLAAALVAGVVGTAAAMEGTAAPLRDGEYDCAVSSGSMIGIMPMGRIDIKGGTYRFRPYGKVKDGFAPYQAGGDGALRWGGHMGALDQAPSVLVDSRRTPQGFNVRYRVRPGALIDTMSCHHM